MAAINHEVIITSYDNTISRYRPQTNIFGHTIYPPSLIVIAFLTVKLRRQERVGGGGGGPESAPWSQKTKQKSV